MPSSLCVGGRRMSTIATSGSCAVDRAEQLLGVAARPTTSMPASSSSARDALAQEDVVLGDHDPHGISARDDRPAAGRARRRAGGRRAPRRDRRGRAGPSRSRRRRRRRRRRRPRCSPSRPAPDAHRDAPTPARTSRRWRAPPTRRRTRRPRRARAAARTLDRTRDRHRRPRWRASSSAASSPCSDDGRMEAAGDLAQLLERQRDLVAARVASSSLATRIVVGSGPERGSAPARRDQPLLRAVVEVALEPLALARRLR